MRSKSAVKAAHGRRRFGLRAPAAALLAGLAAIGSAAQAADYVSTVVASGPLAYFRLDTAGQPSVVNGYTSSYDGGVGTTAAGGGAPLAAYPANRAAVFDGVNDAQPGVINTSLSGGIAGTATIVAWVNLAQLPSATPGTIRYIAGESQGGNDLDLQFEGGDTIRFYTDGGSNAAFTPTGLTTGSWHMIAVTYDGRGDATTDFRNIYWDGALGTAQTGLDQSGASKSSSFAIGYSNVFGGREFNGAIDEVAIWNRALSGAEIANLYASRLDAGAVPEPGSWALMIGGFGLAGGMMRRRAGGVVYAG